MSKVRGDRLATAAVVGFPLLLIAGLLLQGLAVGGAEEESREEVVARYSDGGNELLAEIGALVVGLAIACALVFVASVRAWMCSVEGERGVLATAALAGGTLMGGLLAVSTAANVAAFSSYDFYDAYETDASTVLLLQSVAFYALGFALVGGGVLVGSASIAALRARRLPRWFAAAGLALAAVLVLGEWALFFTFPVPALALWLLLAGVLLRPRPVDGLESPRAEPHNP
jgi:hypothetical protein